MNDKRNWGYKTIYITAKNKERVEAKYGKNIVWNQYLQTLMEKDLNE